LAVYFGGKAGWTSGSRQEAVYIATPDGKAAYILKKVLNDTSRKHQANWGFLYKPSKRGIRDFMTEKQ
jgi:hypothetical protein